MTVIVIVTGGRSYTGAGLSEALDALEREAPSFHLFVGDALGADQIARGWTEDREPRRCHVFAADWKRHGKAAGPRRNADMVAAALMQRKPRRLICVAAPGGRGTADCVRRCTEAGFEVLEVTS